MNHSRRQHNFVCVLSLIVSWQLLEATAATTAAAAAALSGRDSHYCSPAQLSDGLVQHPCNWGREPVDPVFPTYNTARSVTGRELHELLSVSSQHGNSSSRKGGLVVLFYLAGDPPSLAISPVFKCLPAFFHEEVQFVTVAYSELSLMTLMSQGLHALPVLQVNANGRRYRYSGKHWLRPMLSFVSRALAQEPVVSLDIAQFCSSSSSSSSSTRLPQVPSDPPPSTCRPRSLLDVYIASRADAVGMLGRCDRDSMCKRDWECLRWDGEVTLEELREQRPAPLFYISLAFLVLRTVWLLQRWVQRQRRSRRAIMAVAAATAAPAVSPAASPVAEAGTGATATDA